jgi:hypothetical protein
MSDTSTTTLPMVRAAGDSLALLERGRRLLAEALGAGEVKQLRDQAAAVERYLRQQKYAHDAIQDAAELKLRAERRLGELLAGTVRAGNPQLLHDATIGRLPKGVSRTQSHRWQRVAGLPEDVFEAEIAAGRRRGDLSTNALLKLARRKVKRRRRVKADGIKYSLRATVIVTSDTDPRELEDLIRAGLVHWVLKSRREKTLAIVRMEAVESLERLEGRDRP